MVRLAILAACTLQVAAAAQDDAISMFQHAVKGTPLTAVHGVREADAALRRPPVLLEAGSAKRRLTSEQTAGRAQEAPRRQAADAELWRAAEEEARHEAEEAARWRLRVGLEGPDAAPGSGSDAAQAERERAMEEAARREEEEEATLQLEDESLWWFLDEDLRQRSAEAAMWRAMDGETARREEEAAKARLQQKTSRTGMRNAREPGREDS
mmetsp:Transcript_114487/g.355547  ORF Transcript_114487/g.355547 Transcript_114487/m.355547 type:complete len:211 (+) Transcript_114487:127-759(+)